MPWCVAVPDPYWYEVDEPVAVSSPLEPSAPSHESDDVDDAVTVADDELVSTNEYDPCAVPRRVPSTVPDWYEVEFEVAVSSRPDPSAPVQKFDDSAVAITVDEPVEWSVWKYDPVASVVRSSVPPAYW